jgi:hypothetical protein
MKPDDVGTIVVITCVMLLTILAYCGKIFT